MWSTLGIIYARIVVSIGIGNEGHKSSSALAAAAVTLITLEVDGQMSSVLL